MPFLISSWGATACQSATLQHRERERERERETGRQRERERKGGREYLFVVKPLQVLVGRLRISSWKCQGAPSKLLGTHAASGLGERYLSLSPSLSPSLSLPHPRPTSPSFSPSLLRALSPDLAFQDTFLCLAPEIHGENAEADPHRH